MISTATVILGFALLIPPVLCYAIAKSENRNYKRWFFYGLFFGIFAVIYLVFYLKEDTEDKIEFRIMILLVIFTLIVLISLYDTFFGLF